MADSRKVYWDACAWIGLINQEPDRYQTLKHLYESAQRGNLEIWTSTFTYAEVYKKNCGKGPSGSFDANDDIDAQFHNVLTQDFLKLIILDRPIGEKARELLRAYPGIGKPQDAIHLASALRHNLDELHTFDGSDLLNFDGKLQKADGTLLVICVPTEIGRVPLFQLPAPVSEDRTIPSGGTIAKETEQSTEGTDK